MRDKDAGITSIEVAPVVERTVTGQWLPGHAKRGGRKPGVKNWNARTLAEAEDCDGLKVLMEVVLTGYLPLTPGEDPKTRKKVSNELRLKAAISLAEYTYPKLSATHVTSTGTQTVATYDVKALMKDPELAHAAQDLAIAMAEQGRVLPDPRSLDD